MTLDERAWLERFLLTLVRLSTDSRLAVHVPQAAVSAEAPGANGTIVQPAVPGAQAALTWTPPTPAIHVAPGVSAATAVGVALTPALLRKLCARDADLWAPVLAQACSAHGIDTPRRIAAFLANILTETGDLGTLVESLDYTPQALLNQWPAHFTPASAERLGRTTSHTADQRNIAEAAYGGRLGNRPPGSGDGWLFRGRGLIQLTGRTNYQRFAHSIGISVEQLPAHLETHEGAADSAAADWTASGCNAPADAGLIDQCRRIVNGGLVGLAATRSHYSAACVALGIH